MVTGAQTRSELGVGGIIVYSLERHVLNETHIVLAVFWPVVFLNLPAGHSSHVRSELMVGGSCSTKPGWQSETFWHGRAEPTLDLNVKPIRHCEQTRLLVNVGGAISSKPARHVATGLQLGALLMLLNVTANTQDSQMRSLMMVGATNSKVPGIQVVAFLQTSCDGWFWKVFIGQLLQMRSVLGVGTVLCCWP